MSTIKRDAHGLYVRAGKNVLRPVRDSDFFENDPVTARLTEGPVGLYASVAKDNRVEKWVNCGVPQEKKQYA